MTTFMTIMMMVLFFNVLGFFFRIGWKILCGILGFIGFLIRLSLGIAVPSAVAILVWRRSEEYSVLKEVARTVMVRLRSRMRNSHEKERGQDE